MRPLTSLLTALLLAGLASGCATDQAQTATTQTADSIASPAVVQPPSASEATAAPAPVSTDDPALAVLENADVRFKLHGLLEFKPEGDVISKPDPAKKYIMADISCENVGTRNVYPAEYMLSAYLVDNKGQQAQPAAECKNGGPVRRQPGQPVHQGTVAGLFTATILPPARRPGASSTAWRWTRK
jgi:hypothetical protein